MKLDCREKECAENVRKMDFNLGIIANTIEKIFENLYNVHE